MPTAKKSSAKSPKAKIKPVSESIDLIAALQDHFGFNAFKGNQKAIIENLMAGNDTFVIKPTGGGKSLCYQLPAILLPGCAIIVSPLIALGTTLWDLALEMRDAVGNASCNSNGSPSAAR